MRLLSAFSLVALLGLAGSAAGGAPELGAVTWGRDLDRALADSRGSGRPVLVLFQEVPG